MPLVTDDEIKALLTIEKQITNPGARGTTQRGSKRINYDAIGANGERFQVYLRQNMRMHEAFSCGILYHHPSGERITLTRYNGSDHEHTNPLESGKPLPPGCHIHRATAKYIDAGRKAEHYAESTDRYDNLDGALAALILDCNIHGLGDNPTSSQLELL